MRGGEGKGRGGKGEGGEGRGGEGEGREGREERKGKGGYKEKKDKIKTLRCL